MKVTFYGVRGSIPTPGPDTARYGGNTPCVVLQSDSGQKLILDAGTGLRLASNEFENYNDTIHILLSHHHWDHLQGFPFFSPIFKKGVNITIYPGSTTLNHDTAILDQMSKSYFPVKFHQLPSTITLKKTNFSVDEGIEVGDFVIQAMDMNHPDGGSAYRIKCDNQILVYATDNELTAPDSHRFRTVQQWGEFCANADLLIHDAQYLDHEMSQKFGWGHSPISETLNLAHNANVKMLSLFSHDPLRTDEEIDDLTAKILKTNPDFSFFFAKEGQSLILRE
ncbi:MBL fold metallo-hydrolase [uncultured Psychrosphaera sp.]|uniref:MBL fold metallo-hydrolase n=1 Tax=uncultured Psychrosphaera sp. TaxID=1403522 RepID=UPI0030F74404